MTYQELVSQKSQFDIFIDEKEREIRARGKKVRLRYNTISYSVLKQLAQLPGHSITYKKLYRKFWEGPRESSISSTVLMAKKYLNQKTFNIINDFVFQEGDKLSVSSDLKSCLIEITPSSNIS